MLSSLLDRFRADSLFRNSLYLMMATASLSFFGFIFWLIVAKFFSPEEVGLATTLISSTTLISIISLIGFNAALVRFLPSEHNPSSAITTAFFLVTLSSLVIASGFLIALPLLSTKLVFIRDHPILIALFIGISTATALNSLKDSVFLANRTSHFILWINTIFSAVRLAFPVALVGFGAVGIFAAAGIAQAIGFILGLCALIWFFSYRPTFALDRGLIARVKQYSAGNYIASSLNLLPPTILPLFITERLGAPEAAYFYIAMMIANLLYVIPYATTRALFAEGSNDESKFAEHYKSAVRIIALLMIPAIGVLIVAGENVLRLFGANYAAGASSFLTLVALAGLTVSAMSIANSYFQVRRDVSGIIAINAVYAISTLGLSYLLASFGLTGIGMAWLIGNALAALTGFILYRYPLDVTNRYRAISYELWVRKMARERFAKARANGASKTILFYPHLPKYYYVHYTIAHQLGLTMTNDPKAPHDIAMSFYDITLRPDDPIEKELLSKGRFINANARDISKENVEKVFSEVFGYGTFVDPRTFAGECVQKSNENATHDGKVVQCPREPEPGYIYQRLINNRDGDRVSDLRVKVVGGKIPFMMFRTRSAFDRFDNTQTATMVPVDEYLSKDEQQKIVEFCKRMGIDFGALDCLRDRDSSLLYIVDANLTTGTPQPGTHLTREEYEEYIQKFSNAFKEAFVDTL